MPPKNSDILDSFRLSYDIIKDLIKENTMTNDEIGADILKNAHSISIETQDDGKTVKATVYGRNILNNPYIVATSKATCGPNNIFDFNIGAKLAMDRLYEGYDMTPKPKRKPYNGLIYIHKYPGTGLEDRAIYRVVDGKIKGSCYHSWGSGKPYIFVDMTDEMLSRTLQIELYGSDSPSSKTTAYFVHYDQTKD